MLYLTDHAAIAAAVRAAAAVDHIGSPCGRAARAGRKALATAGINAAIATGTLVYRPSTTNVLVTAHAWNEAGDDLIDFSSAGWLEEARDVEWLTDGSPAPTEWVAPPAFIWAPRASVWRPTLDLPPLGQAYYCPPGQIKHKKNERPRGYRAAEERDELAPSHLKEHGLPLGTLCASLPRAQAAAEAYCPVLPQNRLPELALSRNIGPQQHDDEKQGLAKVSETRL
jgi:hypothetical protein